MSADIQQKACLADRLVEILFPAPVKQPEGWWFDHGVDEIDGAIIDIKRQGMVVDAVCMGTIERVAGKLSEARRAVDDALGDRHR